MTDPDAEIAIAPQQPQRQQIARTKSEEVRWVGPIVYDVEVLGTLIPLQDQVPRT